MALVVEIFPLASQLHVPATLPPPTASAAATTTNTNTNTNHQHHHTSLIDPFHNNFSPSG